VLPRDITVLSLGSAWDETFTVGKLLGKHMLDEKMRE
jgi:hypothetical protein